MVTKYEAMTRKYFTHVSIKGADGKPVRCRANGKCQVWKTRPDDFKLPVKQGLYVHGYITPDTAHEWNVACD